MLNRVTLKSQTCIGLITSSCLWIACSGLIRQNQTEAQIYYFNGLRQVKQDQIDQAIHSFRKAIEYNRKYSEAYFELAKIYRAQSSIEAIINAKWALQNAVRFQPHQVKYRLALAKFYLQREFYHSAKSELNHLISRHGPNAESLFLLGYIHELEHLRLRNRITPDSSGATIYFTDFARDELKKTMNFYQRAIQSDSLFLRAYHRLSLIYYDEKNWSAMIRTLRKAIRIDPHDKNSHLYLALAFYRTHRFDLAYREFQEAWDRMGETERQFYLSIDPLLSNDSKNTFANSTDSLKSRLTDAYWQSRDPIFLTDYNERLLEHFARISYANLRFALPQKNIEGWQTDRGKVYIRYGPPANEVKMTASFNELGSGDGNPLISAKIIWSYPDFQFAFEDQFLNENYKFQWDLKDNYDRFMSKVPEVYHPDAGKNIYDLSVLIRQFDTADSLRTLYIFSGFPAEWIHQNASAQQSRLETSLLEGIFVFDENWSPIIKKKINKMPLSESVRSTRNQLFFSVDSIKLTADNYNLAIEFFDRNGNNFIRYHDSLRIDNAANNRLALSDIVLANTIRLKTSLSDINRAAISVFPNFEGTFSAGQDLFLYYEIYNLNLNQRNRSKFRVSHIIKKTESKPGLFSRVLSGLNIKRKHLPEIKTSADYEGDRDRENFYRIIRLKDYDAGDYILVVRVEDENARQSVERSIDFHIR